jgi:outer membrane receptor protein involved in Fe transport
LADILGTDEFDQNFLTWGAYLTSRYELNDTWALLAGAGHSQRPPSLTELYVAETFLLLLQNGLNTATGDPRLAPEKKWQVDLGMACTTERFSGRANAFCAWVNDYITFENMDVIYGPPAGQVEQEQLKYVNTDWALLTGFELQGEYQANDWLSPFGTLRYVEGRDLTRNGDFATTQAVGKTPSTRVYGLPRGFFSGIAGGAEEPLPGIVPLESRLGLRVHQAAATPRWGTELAVRVVDGQYRIATSLLELPTPGFAVWDFRSYWRPNDTWLLVAGVENFGNRTYREHLDFRNQSGIGVYQPGVSFYFGSELTY